MSDSVQHPTDLKILIIGKHWPEPASSAAGSRMMQLVAALQSIGNITFASAAARGEYSGDLESLGINCVDIRLNHSSFDEFVKELQPDMVMFDRFMTEEQFGWRVEKHCPGAVRILDTEDLHGLREARQQAVKQNRPVVDEDFFNDVAIRELAAIYCSDLSLIISEAEMEIVQSIYKVPAECLLYLPFMIEKVKEGESTKNPGFHERQNFISIGNFLHAPNRDAVHYLKTTIWPLIRKQLPDAQVLIYGAYPDDDIRRLDDPDNGFCVKGRAEDAELEMRKARVCLAPLRFGAGLKGKMITAMQCETPVVTTPIGSEGISGEMPWPGAVSDHPESFAASAIQLYQDEQAWRCAQQHGQNILQRRFQKDYWSPVFIKSVIDFRNNLAARRRENVVGRILHHQSLRSTEYMSRWIELKNDRTVYKNG